MKLSVLLILNDNIEQNLDAVKKIGSGELAPENIELFAAYTQKDPELIDKIKEYTAFDGIKFAAFSDKAVLYNKFLASAKGKFCSVVEAGSDFDIQYFSNLINNLLKNPEIDIAMGKKIFTPQTELLPDENDVFCPKAFVNDGIINLKEVYNCFPWFFEGTVLKTEFAKKYSFEPELGLEAEKSEFIKMLLDKMKFLYLPSVSYIYTTAKDNHYRFFHGMYDIDWYYKSVDKFFVPLCKYSERLCGEIPVFVQHFMLEMMLCRFRANSDNRNKHLIEEPDNEVYYKQIQKVLIYLDDTVVCNSYDLPIAEYSIMVRKLFLKIKYDDPTMQLGCVFSNKNLYATKGEIIMFSIKDLKVNIVLMDYRNGCLEIDATYPDVFNERLVNFYADYNNKIYMPHYNQRYTLTKYFGVSCYKRKSFHLSIPIDTSHKTNICFVMEYKGKKFTLSQEYSSHTSRISTSLVWDYWKIDENIIVCHSKEGIQIQPASKPQRFYRQLRVFHQLLFSKKKRTKLVFGARLLYFITRPFFKNKNIWMFYDKIYKGGDSSEYLYKYALSQKEKGRQKDNISCYYLIDKSAPDAKRLRKEGYKPVYRNSMLHRLLFFNADMMIVSNSTVFAFNDMPMYLSTYFRGITDFHVVCVQHGLSVQKIAIAQNRLRDNTRLYYCASKYEIENLSKPVYDYVGYDALRLTGVPRYDGLKDNDQRQIMLSPTWRMQSAMLVSKNEGVARDYNPDFRETPYFKVFNSLINDKRLLKAAKRYNYRIAYVLHPIVSPQAEDFDKNDYVDIIPATGDMSYEKLFCESSLMVTDFSGIQFDFAYMRKPLVYLHHDDIPQHYEEGTYHYDTMAFGEIVHNNEDLIDLLIEYMKNDCKMKNKYKKRADDFFAFSDHNNCQRIYDDMIEYQKKIGKISG